MYHGTKAHDAQLKKPWEFRGGAHFDHQVFPHVRKNLVRSGNILLPPRLVHLRIDKKAKFPEVLTRHCECETRSH
jgi:hypothetical protein